MAYTWKNKYKDRYSIMEESNRYMERQDNKDIQMLKEEL